MFQASFHTRLTLRASWYAPPDTRVPNLQLIAVEQLPSIEGAVEIRMDFTFLRGSLQGRGAAPPVVPMKSAPAGGAEPRPYRVHPMASPMKGRQCGCTAPKAPLSGELSAKLTERLSQICCNLSVSAYAEPPPLEGGGSVPAIRKTPPAPFGAGGAIDDGGPQLTAWYKRRRSCWRRGRCCRPARGWRRRTCLRSCP